jgi:(p)ppGpp synthase/HD superfamily hydrolase
MTSPGWFSAGPFRFSQAFSYALELHNHQVRKQAPHDDPANGIPYISHLMMVAALVIEHGGDEDEAIAALLHDGPEDCGGRETLEAIRHRFGSRVADIVETCTDTFDNPKPDWGIRKKKYVERLRSASDSALLVSLADKTHNAEATLSDVTELGDDFWNRFTQGRRGSLWYYGSLVEIYRTRVNGKARRLVDRLERAFHGLCRGETERESVPAFGPPPEGVA